jgi:hypothetical protein
MGCFLLQHIAEHSLLSRAGVSNKYSYTCPCSVCCAAEENKERKKREKKKDRKKREEKTKERKRKKKIKKERKKNKIKRKNEKIKKETKRKKREEKKKEGKKILQCPPVTVCQGLTPAYCLQ